MKLLFVILLSAVLIVSFWLQSTSAGALSKPQNVYWGKGKQPKKVDKSIRPFKIHFSKQMISDLKLRLKNTRKLQPSLPNVNWTYGVNSDFIPKIVDYWLHKYNFQKREKHLNRYPQYLTNIQGLDIHFYHIKPKLPKNRKLQVLPLLILHGWPGSVVEFQKVMPLLTTPRSDQDFVFELVVPSLPGYGYSSPPAKVGLDAIEMGLVFKNLMKRLKHKKFYVQGGDWGSIITSNMAAMYPDNILGLHSNLCFTLNPLTWAKIIVNAFMPSVFPKDPQYYSVKQQGMIAAEFGYLYEHSTKPDTVGVAESDSPAGLAAYILEEFSTTSNIMNKYKKDGNLLQNFTMDELLDNVMFYWAPNKATTSFRLYAEFMNTKYLMYRLTAVPITVPSACAIFPHEHLLVPEMFLSERYQNLVSVTHPSRGGHFAAMEEPKLFADDVFYSVKKMKQS